MRYPLDQCADGQLVVNAFEQVVFPVPGLSGWRPWRAAR